MVITANSFAFVVPFNVNRQHLTAATAKQVMARNYEWWSKTIPSTSRRKNTWEL